MSTGGSGGGQTSWKTRLVFLDCFDVIWMLDVLLKEAVIWSCKKDRENAQMSNISRNL
jgi:hypothetical protein